MRAGVTAVAALSVKPFYKSSANGRVYDSGSLLLRDRLTS